MEDHKSTSLYRALATLVFGDAEHAAVLEQLDAAQRRRFSYHYEALCKSPFAYIFINSQAHAFILSTYLLENH